MGAVIAVLVVVLIVALAVIAWLVLQQRRSRDLQEQFGPEYGHTVHALGNRGRAEKELAARRERVEQLHIRPLSQQDQQRFSTSWQQVQARFVDDPRAATEDADKLIGDVMSTRGYPVGDFEAQAADLSVSYPTVVSNYRAAHAIAQNAARGDVATEDLRQAFVHYRALFQELVEAPQPAAMEGRR
jgi:hypothetical protein